MTKDSNVRKGKILSFIPTGEYYFNKGLTAFERHDLKNAKKYLTRAQQLDPAEPVIACQLGIVYMQLEEYEQANDLFFHIITELDKDMVECHYFLANNFAELGLFNEAFKHIKTYLDKEAEGEFAEDAEELLFILESEVSDTETFLEHEDDFLQKQEKVNGLLESGKFEEAIQLLKQLITDYPTYWSAYNHLALAYVNIGEMQKAGNVLNDILDKNPGNLHALCNKAVFLYHQRRDQELTSLLDTLEKVQPISIDHQYKLGATFALVGRFESAFQGLYRLKKQGFEGDESFLYWFAISAYKIGRKITAEQAWKHLIELNPEKKGLEPWNQENVDYLGYENQIDTMIKKMESDYIEERLLGIFLLSHSERKQELIGHPKFKNIDEFSFTEKIYLANVLNAEIKSHFDPNGMVNNAHQVACMLYDKHRPIGSENAGLFLMWFTVFVEGAKHNQLFTNIRAFAAATEYIWHRICKQKKSQSDIAHSYQVAVSTLQKYIKIVETYC